MITIALPAINLLFLLGLVGGVLAIIDAIIRIRAHSAVLGVIEVIVAALFTLSLFVSGVPFAPYLAVLTILLLVLGLAFRGNERRGGVPITVIAIIVLLAFTLFAHQITIVGVNA